jgi:cell division protein FtsB
MRRPAREQMRQGLALCVLLLLAGFAIAGPTGLLAWGENVRALKQREARIAILTDKRDALRNRVELLDPEAADPDLASELVRKNLGVLHADEVMITLEDDMHTSR